MKSWKLLHTQLIKDVVDHSVIKYNPSFLHGSVKNCLGEIDRLLEIMQLIAESPCKQSENVHNNKMECGHCIAKSALDGLNPLE